MEYTIKTDRLDLHPLSESDFDFIQKLRTRPEYFKYENDVVYNDGEITKQFNGFLEGAKNLPNKGSIQWIMLKLEKYIFGIGGKKP